MIVSRLGWWGAELVILKLGLRPSFVLNDKLRLFPDLYDEALDLLFWRWSCSFILNDKSWLFRDWNDGLLDLEFWSRSFSFTHNDKSWLFPDLDDGALDLSSWSWAFGPASFQMTNYDSLWTWMRGHWTCQFEAGTSALFLMTNYDRFQTWMLGHWTCHFEAGPWPSFVLDSKLWFFRTLMMTQMGHWTVHFDADLSFEAGPSAQLHS